MLEKIDLTKKIKKKEYKQRMPVLRDHLYALQKASWDAQIPVIILFEGWDAAGKGTSIQKLTARLDPRGFKLYPIRAARTYEKKHPWLWRFWLKIPGRGEWAIFDRSWYGRCLVERMENLISEKEWRRAYRDIVDFERALADDGYLILKFFLHISHRSALHVGQDLSNAHRPVGGAPGGAGRLARSGAVGAPGANGRVRSISSARSGAGGCARCGARSGARGEEG
jgi:polyphosphate kinase 2 (PPK2 family)